MRLAVAKGIIVRKFSCLVLFDMRRQRLTGLLVAPYASIIFYHVRTSSSPNKLTCKRSAIARLLTSWLCCQLLSLIDIKTLTTEKKIAPF